jgi:hypothetical protein
MNQDDSMAVSEPDVKKTIHDQNGEMAGRTAEEARLVKNITSEKKDSKSVAHSAIPKKTTPKERASISKLMSPVPFSRKSPEKTLSPSSQAENISREAAQPTADHLTAEPSVPSRGRSMSPQNHALVAEGQKIVAEMEKYSSEIDASSSPVVEYKFPSSPEADDSPFSPGIVVSPEVSVPVSVSDKTQSGSSSGNSSADANRLSMGSTMSSASSSDAGHTQTYYLHPHHDVNPNRLSGVSSISTSSYESHTSTSSEGLVGVLKTKISAWTHKLGGGAGRRYREEEAEFSASRSTLAFQQSTTSIGHSSPHPPPEAELRDMLRGHALGSSQLGSRMARSSDYENVVLPSHKIEGKEGDDKPLTKPSVRSAWQSDLDVLEMGSSGRHDFHKTSTLPAKLNRQEILDYQQAFGDSGDREDLEGLYNSSQRRESESSAESGDSFYERRFSLALESPRNPDSSQNTPVTSPRRKSIKEVVQVCRS